MSRYLINQKPKKPHLMRAGGVAAEVQDVRKDVEAGFDLVQVEIDASVASGIVPVGTMKGRQVDAGSTGALVNLTGAEQAENWRRNTIQTISDATGVIDVVLNNDTTVLLIRTIGNCTLRTVSSVAPNSNGREVVIEHDRQSGTGILTIPHNTAGTGTPFFNPDLTALYLGQTTSVSIRLRSGFWRPRSPRRTRIPGTPVYDVMEPPFNAAGTGLVDDTAALNAAIAAANATSGDVYLGNKHLISGPLTAITRDAVSIIGRGCRGDGTLLTVTGASPYNVFTFNTVKDCGLYDVFIEGPGTWASRGLGVFIDDCFRTHIERVEVTDTYGGIEIYASVITEIIETYLADTLGPYGFYAYGSLADGENHALRFIGCATGGNLGGSIAWYKQGSGSHTFELINCGALEGGIGLLVTDDTPYTGSSPRFTRTLNFQADHCAQHGVHLVNGATANFTHTFLTSTTGTAFRVESTYSGNWEINGGMFHGTAGHGAAIACDHWSITGLQIGNIDATFDMLRVEAGVTDFSITGCTLGDIFGDNSSAAYGINLDATNDRFTIIGNRILGNDTGAINNPAGPATTRVIQGNTPTSVNTVRIDELETMTVGTMVGRSIVAGSTGRPTALTPAQQGENIRFTGIATDTTSSGVIATYTITESTTQVRANTAGAVEVRGISIPVFQGQRIIFHREPNSAGAWTFRHNTGGGTTQQQLFMGLEQDYVLGEGQSLEFEYSNNRWRHIGGNVPPKLIATISVAVPTIAVAGTLAYVDVTFTGITTADTVVANPTADLAAAGAASGFYVGCRASAANTVRLAFIGILAGGSVNFNFARVNN